MWWQMLLIVHRLVTNTTSALELINMMHAIHHEGLPYSLQIHEEMFI